MTVYPSQTYTNPSTLNSDPGDPVTSELMKAALFNMRAMAQGAAGSDAIADAVFEGQRTSSGTSIYTVTEYGGVWLDFIAYAGSAGTDAVNIEIDVSDDNQATWSSKLSITSALVTNEYRTGTFFLDYTAGAYMLLINSSDTITDLGRSTGNIGSWPVDAITDMRITVTITATAKASWIGRHQGGNSL